MYCIGCSLDFMGGGMILKENDLPDDVVESLGEVS